MNTVDGFTLRPQPVGVSRPHEPFMLSTQHVDEVVFGGKAEPDRGIPERFQPVTLEQDGVRAQLAVVQDEQGDHLVLHSTGAEDGMTRTAVLSGVPTGMMLKAGYTSLYIEPDGQGAYSVLAEPASTPPAAGAALEVELDANNPNLLNPDWGNSATYTLSHLLPGASNQSYAGFLLSQKSGENDHAVVAGRVLAAVIPNMIINPTSVCFKVNDGWLVWAGQPVPPRQA